MVVFGKILILFTMEISSINIAAIGDKLNSHTCYFIQL